MNIRETVARDIEALGELDSNISNREIRRECAAIVRNHPALLPTDCKTQWEAEQSDLIDICRTGLTEINTSNQTAAVDIGIRSLFAVIKRIEDSAPTWNHA